MSELKKHIKRIKEKFTLEEIKEHLNAFKGKKVLIIGDTIIDEYCFVDPKGRAMKDPILSVNHIRDEKYAGGILAIANHVSNFVESVNLVTLIGDQNNYKEFIANNLNNNVVPHFFIKNESPTTVKRRFLNISRNEKLFKIEHINDKPISKELEEKLNHFLQQELPKYDVVLVGDFGHGFINAQIVKTLEEHSKFLSVNVQTNSANIGFNYITRYNSPSFLTMDGIELKLALGEKSTDYEFLINKLHQQKQFKNFLVTLGRRGTSYFNNGSIINSPAFVSKTTDVVGAGDAAFSVTSLLASIGADRELIPFIANCVGGIAVNIMGNKESVTTEMLLKFIKKIYKTVEEEDISDYFDGVSKTLNNLNKTHVVDFAKLLMKTYHNEGTIYIFGNGGSGATASHFCGDLVKGVSYGLDKRFKVISLNDNIPTLMSIANDISYDDIFVEQLKNFLQEKDLVIGISGSGNSVNIVKAMEYAKQRGVTTLAVSGYKGGKIKEIADITVHAEVDDMEISEDVHNIIITHCIKRILTKELNNTNVGEEYSKRVS